MLMVCGADYLDSFEIPILSLEKSRRQGMEGGAEMVTGSGSTRHAGSIDQE
jgi:hypothetical protein